MHALTHRRAPRARLAHVGTAGVEGAEHEEAAAAASAHAGRVDAEHPRAVLGAAVVACDGSRREPATQDRRRETDARRFVHAPRPTHTAGLHTPRPTYTVVYTPPRPSYTVVYMHRGLHTLRTQWPAAFMHRGLHTPWPTYTVVYMHLRPSYTVVYMHPRPT